VRGKTVLERDLPLTSFCFWYFSRTGSEEWRTSFSRFLPWNLFRTEDRGMAKTSNVSFSG